jgi:hypothetical protein
LDANGLLAWHWASGHIIHETPGLNPLVVRFANGVADAGLTSYLPSLFGEPGRPASIPYVLGSIINVMCVRREFTLWSANRSSPIVDWLRALARRAYEECGARGVGAIGLCLTGGFAIAMMMEPKVIAPALAEPSLPLPLTPENRGGIDASEQEIACARQRLNDEDLTMIGLRFRGNPLLPHKRFETLKLVRVGVVNAPIKIMPGTGGNSTTLNSSYDGTTLTVTLNLSAFASDFTSPAKSLCVPQLFCEWDGSKCVGRAGFGNLT